MLASDFIRRLELSGGQRLTELRRFYNSALRGGSAMVSDNPLIIAAWKNHGEVGAVKELIDEAKYNIDAQDKRGQTALTWAAENGHADIVQELVDAGANLELKNESGKTALMLAAERGWDRVVQALVDAGAVVNEKDDSGMTALMLAAKSGWNRVVQALVDAGAVVNEKDNYGMTALMWAALGDHLDVVQALLDAGAVLDVKNKEGKTALQLTSHENVQKIIEKKALEMVDDDTEDLRGGYSPILM